MELKLECEPFYFIFSLLFSKVVDKTKKKKELKLHWITYQWFDLVGDADDIVRFFCCDCISSIFSSLCLFQNSIRVIFLVFSNHDNYTYLKPLVFFFKLWGIVDELCYHVLVLC